MMYDRLKMLEIKFGTDAFTPTDLKGQVFLRLGDPTDLLSIKVDLDLFGFSNNFHKLIKKFRKAMIGQRHVAI